MIHHQAEEAAQLVQFVAQIGVEQRLVPLAPAPEHVILAAQVVGHLQHVLHLRRGIGEDVGIGIGGGPAHVAAVGEEVGGAPEQASARLLHLAREYLGDGAHVAVAFRQRRAFGGDVAVVEAEIGGLEDIEHLERDLRLQPRAVHVVCEPRPLECLATEGIAAGPDETVPVADGEAQVVPQALAHDHMVGVVVAEGEGIGGSGAFVPDFLDVPEKVAHPHALPADLDAQKRACHSFCNVLDYLKP